MNFPRRSTAGKGGLHLESHRAKLDQVKPVVDAPVRPQREWRHEDKPSHSEFVSRVKKHRKRLADHGDYLPVTAATQTSVQTERERDMTPKLAHNNRANKAKTSEA
eukprot:6200321-Pleurochrysis_carterae.AAC.1